MLPLVASLLLALLLAFAGVGLAHAEQPLVGGGGNGEGWVGGVTQGADTFDVVQMVVRVIVSLIIIIGIFILIIKIISQKNHRWASGRSIRTLGGVVLGQNKSLQVIELAGAIYIIGIGDDVRLIEKVDDEAEVERIIESFSASGRRGGELGRFSLSGLFGQRASSETELSEKSFQQLFQQNMDSMRNRKQKVEDMLYDENNNDRSSNK